jgi:dTDP-4-dehydrorhamnose reductase
MREMTWIAKRPRDSSLNYDETKKRIKTNFYSTETAFKVLKEELA